MCEQTNQAPAKDPARMRWEYLRKVNTTFAQCAVWTLVTMAGYCPMGIGIILVLLGAFNQGVQSIFPWLLVVIGSLIGTLGFVKLKPLAGAIHTIDYVPSVPVQIAALPAEDVLLRASDEPAATLGELLRAAPARNEQPAEELLRAEQGNPR